MVDDFTVEVTKSPVAAVSDYYPPAFPSFSRRRFGMWQARNSTNSKLEVE